MRRTGGRLSVAESFSRPAQLESIPGMADTNSASLAKAEREIKRLKLENQKLKIDLNDTRSLYNQLTQENSHEQFEERRVTLLKSQIIQLERQILVLNEALSSRGEVLLDVENSLVWLADKCRSYIVMDVRGPLVNIERSDLTLMVETAESARIKLYKQLESKTTEKLSRPLKFYTEFVHPSKADNLTLLEVASGNMEHLNLKHVTKLETRLSELYRELVHLHQLMDDNTKTEPTCPWTSGHVIAAARERLVTQILKACAMTKDCASDLLELSLLFPSAPWPPLKKPALKEVTADRVLDSLPGFPRSKASEGQQVIQALVRAYNYKVHMLNTRIKGLGEDVKYHQKVYNLQLKYTESLFQAIREAYTAFEDSSNEVIVKPLKEILEAYVMLNQTASEASLKRFLSIFKDSAPQLNDIIETIGVKAFEESEGSKVLSQFGEEFFENLEKVVREQQAKRDREANKMEEVKAEQQRLDSELRELLEEQENNTRERLSRFEHSQDVEERETIRNERHESPTSVNREKSDYKPRGRLSRLDNAKDVKERECDRSAVSDGNENTHFCSQNQATHSESPAFVSRDESHNDKPKNRTALDSNHSKVIHKQDWVNIVDVRESSSIQLTDGQESPDPSSREEMYPRSKKRTVPDINSSKVLHKKEWVNIVEPNNALSSDGGSEGMTDRELLQHEQLGNRQEIEALNAIHRKDSSHSEAAEDSRQADKPPVKLKTKKKLNYVPNTFVPNRTLQLRRSGSLTRLASDMSDGKGEWKNEEVVKEQDVVKKSSAKERQARSQSRERARPSLPHKSRPAFR